MKKLFLLSFMLMTSYGVAQEALKTESEVKIYSPEEGVLTKTKYANSTALNQLSNPKKVFFQAIDGLVESINQDEALKKWNMISAFKSTHSELDSKELLRKIHDVKAEEQISIALEIWERSLKSEVDILRDELLITAIKDRLVDSEDASYDPVAVYFVIEAETQMIARREQAKDIFFKLFFPEESTDISDEGDLITTFETHPLGYLIDYYSLDYEPGYLQKIVNSLVLKEEIKPTVIQKSEVITNKAFKIVKTGNRESFIENKTTNNLTFYLVGQDGTLRQSMVAPNGRHGFVFSRDDQKYKIQLENGKQYLLGPYKLFLFE